MAQRTTTLGTPCSPLWSDAWIARVDEVEAQLGRRICGGVSAAESPCTLESTHRSGRCRFHGGSPGVGGQPRNDNALVHGLYQRRLKVCGPQCPLWDSCPYAGKDVEDMPAAQRPVCHYEQEEYDALLRNYLGATRVSPDELPGEDDPDVNTARTMRFAPLESDDEPFLTHHAILLQIMVSRAAAALAHTALTDESLVQSGEYCMKTTKPGAALEAFMRLSREYRAYRGFIAGKYQSNRMAQPEPAASTGLADAFVPIGYEVQSAISAEVKRQKAAVYRKRGEPVPFLDQWFDGDWIRENWGEYGRQQKGFPRDPWPDLPAPEGGPIYDIKPQYKTHVYREPTPEEVALTPDTPLAVAPYDVEPDSDSAADVAPNSDSAASSRAPSAPHEPHIPLAPFEAGIMQSENDSCDDVAPNSDSAASSCEPSASHEADIPLTPFKGGIMQCEDTSCGDLAPNSDSASSSCVETSPPVESSRIAPQPSPSTKPTKPWHFDPDTVDPYESSYGKLYVVPPDVRKRIIEQRRTTDEPPP